MLPAEKLRLRKSTSGNIGSRLRDSCTTKHTNKATPSRNGTKTAGLPQPRRGCSMSANTGPPRPRAHSSPPSTSILRAFSRRGLAAGITAKINTTQIATNGRLIRKIARHEKSCSSPPPASGPSTVAIPPQAVQLPIAGPRSDSAKVATMTAKALGVSSALATPCKARAAISAPIVGARAHSNEAAPKPPTPSAKIRRSPYRSPSEPPIRINDPSVSR